MADQNSDFDEILKNFKGYDSNGNIVIGDDDTGEFQSLDKTDFSKIYDYAKTKVNPNLKFDDTYKDFQAKSITKDKQYLGQDNSGQSVFKNQAGVIERANLDFADGLKRQFGDKTFNKQDEGIKNQVAGENQVQLPFSQQRQGNSAISNIANLNQRNVSQAGFQAPRPQGTMFKPDNNSNINTMKKPVKPTPPVKLPTIGAQAQSNQAQQQSHPNLTQVGVGMAQNYAQNQVNNAQNAATSAVKSEVNNQTKAVTQPYVNQAKSYGQEMLNKYIPNEYKDTYGQGMGYLDTAKQVQNVLQDPKAAAMNMAKTYATNTAKDYLKDQLADTALSSFTDGSDIGGAINVGRSLFGGGDARSKGDAAARAAAQAALAASTGGISTVVNPDTLRMASGLTDKLTDQTDKLGIAGKPLGLTTSLASGQMKNAAIVGDEALNAIGKTGGDFFASNNETFKGAKDAVKNLTSGNVSEGLKGLGSTALKSVANTLIKTPVSALKNVASSVGSAVKKIFCFAPGTEILMKDGSTKKVEEIKVNDEVALGGKVIAVGTGLGTEFVVIKGVHVISSHALFENGKWIRAEESKNIEQKYSKPDGIVHPIVTEQHLIVTQGQIWADTFEHDDQQDMTKKEIITDLNKDKRLKNILTAYLKIRGWV